MQSLWEEEVGVVGCEMDNDETRIEERRAEAEPWLWADTGERKADDEDEEG